MRNKIEEEERREEIRKQREMPLREEPIISDREVVRTRSNSNFSFPVEMDEPSERTVSTRPSRVAFSFSRIPSCVSIFIFSSSVISLFLK